MIGEARGEPEAWWLEDGAAGKKWRIELPSGNSIVIAASTRVRKDDALTPHEQFHRNGQLVAAIYVDYHTRVDE